MIKRMKKLVRWLMVIMIPVVICHNWENFNPFTKLTLVASLTVLVPIAFYMLSVMIEQKTRELTVAQEMLEKKALEEYIDKVYLKERIQYYQDAHYLFNQLMRAGKLERKDILKLKRMINASLGSYIQEYKNRHFKNDAHEIYSKMKDKHIDEKEWSEIIEFLVLKAS